LQPRARLEQVRTVAVDLRIFLGPENVASFGVEEHDALRQDVDRLAQPFVGFSRFRDRGFRLGALARDLADFRGYAPTPACEFRAGLRRPAWNADDRRMLEFFLLPLSGTRHYRPIRILRRIVFR